MRELEEVTSGGFTYLSPEFEDKDLCKVISLDVNSLYPSVMRFKSMPIRRGCIL